MKETDLPWTLPCSCSLPPSLDAICGNQIPAGAAAEGNYVALDGPPVYGGHRGQEVKVTRL